MIIWQVNWNTFDSHHKKFVLAKDEQSNGRSNKSNGICTFKYAKTRPNAYYFYMELIK